MEDRASAEREARSRNERASDISRPAGVADETGEAAHSETSRARWALKGARNAVAVPAFVLSAACFGFGGLAREMGYTLDQVMLMTASIWALPSMVVLVGAVAGGAGLIATAFAVTLSAVRLMPMTMSLMPVLRGPKTRLSTLLILSHFIAVTAWVESLRRLPSIPRAARVPYFAGFAVMLMSLVVLASGAGHAVSTALPAVLAAGLFLLTPAYFLLSLTAAATSLAERLAMIFGLGLGPAVYLVAPGADLLVSGLVGGTAAFAIGRVWGRA